MTPSRSTTRRWAAPLALLAAAGIAVPAADAAKRTTKRTTTTTATPTPTPTATVATTPSATTPTTSTSSACPLLPTTQAFAPWGDTADYSLLDGGGFELGTIGWQLNTTQARIVADQDRFNVGGTGTRALELGAPASAASPAFCVDTTNPHFKFMVKTLKAATLTTIIQYQRADGTWANAMSAQVARGVADWQPTDPNPLSTSVPGLVAGQTAKVRLWWINTGGVSRIDSVMVDPYRRR